MSKEGPSRRRFLGTVAAIAGLGGASAAEAGTPRAPGAKPAKKIELSNRNLALTIDAERGCITAIHNKLTDERHDLHSVEFTIVTDQGNVSSSQMRVARTAPEADRVVLELRSESWNATLHLQLGESWVEKWVEFHCEKPVVLQRIVLGDRRYHPGFREIYAHSDNTSYNVPVNWFLRTDHGGWYTGIEYPYMVGETHEGGLRLAFGGWRTHYDLSGRAGFADMVDNRPSTTELQSLNVPLKAGETFTTEKEFLGVFRKTGLNRDKAIVGVPRIITTIPETLDWGEVWAMQDFMRHVMPVLPKIQDDFELYMNGWWAGLPGGAITANDVAPYKNATDVSVEMGVKVFSFSPSWVGMAKFFERDTPFVRTVGKDLHFELSAPAREVVDYVESRGLALAPYCEPASHYREDRPDWKLVQENGQKSQMLCWANPDAIEWYLALHRKIIDRDKAIKYWGWDGGWLAGETEKPTADGPFSWVCEATNHQHLPGNIAYPEYRQVMSFFRRLRTEGRYVGTIVAWAVKSGGPWARRHIDSHENYYENQGPDDLRFQMWYNQNSNFLPAEKNMAQIWFEFTPSTMKLPENTRDYWRMWYTPGTRDYRYGMMSALSGGVDLGYLVQLPKFDSDAGKHEYLAFMSKWSQWATANLGCLKIKRDIFGQPLRPNGIDGNAHCVDDHGFIFVFNPTGDRHIGRIPLDDRIRLTSGKGFHVRVIYPESGESLGSYEYGKPVLVDMPAGECKLLEVVPHPSAPISPVIPSGADIQEAF